MKLEIFLSRNPSCERALLKNVKYDKVMCRADQYSIISLKLKNVIHVRLGLAGWPLRCSPLELHHYPIPVAI